MGEEEEDQHQRMMSIHPYIFQKNYRQGKETALHREERDKSVHSYMQSTLYFDVSLHGGIPPGRPPDLELVRDILPLSSPFLDSREVRSLENDFGMRDVKVARNSMRRASYARSPALSLGRIDPYWRSQLLVEYSKDLGACMILDDPDGDDRFMVDDMVIYSYGRVFLTRASSLKEKLLHAAHEDFSSMHLDAYFHLMEEFTWEGIQHDLFQHMERCITQMMMKKRSQPLPYSLEVRERF